MTTDDLNRESMARIIMRQLLAEKCGVPPVKIDEEPLDLTEIDPYTRRDRSWEHRKL